MKKVVIFARVSTTIQDYDRQVSELTALAANNNWKVCACFTEKISGAKANTERTELLRMVEYVTNNAIDKVLVTELSRLGRNTLGVLEVIELLNSLHIHSKLCYRNTYTRRSNKSYVPISYYNLSRSSKNGAKNYP